MTVDRKVNGNVKSTTGGRRYANGYKGGTVATRRGMEGFDERSAEQSPRLGPLLSRLWRPNARLKSTGLRPAPQLRTLLGYT